MRKSDHYKMKKIILGAILSLSTLMLSAQDLSTLILSMPDNIIMGLDTDQKLTLSASTIAKDTATIAVQTPIYENIVRTNFSDDLITLKTSNIGTTQIKLLTLINDSKIICVIKTVKGKVSDSSISFYTTKWQPIPPTSLFPEKTIDWFLNSDIDRTSQDYVNATAIIDMLPVALSYDGKNNDITATFDIEGYLSEQDYKKLKPFLSESPKVLNWNKTTYK